MNHAAICNAPYTWKQVHKSTNPDGYAQAFEFWCHFHAKTFWLAVPPECEVCGRAGEGVNHHHCEFCEVS